MFFVPQGVQSKRGEWRLRCPQHCVHCFSTGESILKELKMSLRRKNIQRGDMMRSMTMTKTTMMVTAVMRVKMTSMIMIMRGGLNMRHARRRDNGITSHQGSQGR